jgi:FixJ family two-component response regulator
LLGFVHVVDDDASFRTAFERRLKKAGYEVATYPSAQHLLDRLPSESEPGCILLDVRIPALSGPELQGRLSELGSTLPIIFLTGYPDISTTVQAIKAGASDFLTKPVSSDELLKAIERAIAHHEVTRGLKSKLDMVRARIATLTPRELQVFVGPSAVRTRTAAKGASSRPLVPFRQLIFCHLALASMSSAGLDRISGMYRLRGRPRPATGQISFTPTG